jgi:hypothetical protein
MQPEIMISFYKSSIPGSKDGFNMVWDMESHIMSFIHRQYLFRIALLVYWAGHVEGWLPFHFLFAVDFSIVVFGMEVIRYS